MSGERQKFGAGFSPGALAFLNWGVFQDSELPLHSFFSCPGTERAQAPRAAPGSIVLLSRIPH